VEPSPSDRNISFDDDETKKEVNRTPDLITNRDINSNLSKEPSIAFKKDSISALNKSSLAEIEHFCS
jgi:hypothetical protein